jgi:acetylornithine deacetylase
MNDPDPSQPQPETLECLRQLIAFDTTSRNSNLELIEWAASHLRRLGAVLRFSHNTERTKANLFATFGEGPGGLIFSGHTDVVPVDGQNWSSDPFSATIKNDCLYGRGACDMKGFVGVVLGQARLLATARLRKPIHIALTYDEEVGCLGVPRLLQDLHTAGIKPEGCIVGEPSSMRLITAHKGGRIYKCRVRGKAAHSSLTPRAVNAIEYASRLITFINGLALAQESGGPRIEGFDVPHATISTNLIAGGTGGNIVPADCEFMFDYRYLPGTSPDELIVAIQRYATQTLEPAMKRRDFGAGIRFECIGRIPALDDQQHEEIAAWVQSVVGPHEPGKVAYGTEASFFQEAGIPSVVCGPGSIDNAHRPDEFVSFEQLRSCERMVRRLAAKLSR